MQLRGQLASLGRIVKIEHIPWSVARRLNEMSNSSNARHADDLRTSLRIHLEANWLKDSCATIIEELGLCQGEARVDLAVINSELQAFEIKSDRDDLRRLTTQADIYGRVFDRITLVCTDRHKAQAKSLIPAWWGILLVRGEDRSLTFKRERQGRRNPRLDLRALAQFLWLDAAVELLEKRQAIRGLRGKPKRFYWDRVSDLFSLEELSEAVRVHLKATAKTRGRQPQLK